MTLEATVQNIETNGFHYGAEILSGHRVSRVETEVRELKKAVKEFARLEEETGDFSFIYSRMISETHSVMAAIRKCLISGMTRDEILPFMEAARRIYRRSHFVARAQDWVRGYPGDFETIEYICDGVNRVAASDLLGRCIEDYSLNGLMAQQHRNKVRLQADRICRTALTRENARILSIGCGGARDVRLTADLLENTSATFVLCDSDAEALECARINLGKIAERCTFVHGKVPRVLNKIKGQFDLVVAGGLFDYLPERWIESILRHIWTQMLNPGGTIFFTNIARGNPYSPLIEYFCDWLLIERDEDDLQSLCMAAGLEKFLSMYRDQSNLAIISELTRPQ